MPPPRRARLSSHRPYYSVAASERSSTTRGWLAVRHNNRRPSKRARARPSATTTIASHGDAAADDDVDDGTPLTDEILVGIFAGLPDFSDLVRCAATCRRWCRLVSGEAAFICRSSSRRRRPPRPHVITTLALGFFYAHRPGAVPRFAATASASRRRLALRQPSLNALVEGVDDGLFDSSRLVASRNGLVVVELQRRNKRERALRLCAVHPMTGEVTVLPSLGGKEIVRPYATAIVTADDYYHDAGNDDDDHDDSPPARTRSPAASYDVLLVYCRRGHTACRTYASESGRWGPEEKVADDSGGGRLGKKQLAAMAAAGRSVVVRKTVYWYTRPAAIFGLRLGTLRAEHLKMPVTAGNDPSGHDNTLLGVSPDQGGCLRVVQVVERTSCPSPGTVKRSAAIVVVTGRIVASTTSGGNTCLWDQNKQPRQTIEVVGRSLPAETTWIRLQWMCEKSGVVFFAAGCDGGAQTCDVYAMSLDNKQEVEKVVANHHGGGPAGTSWENLHGYEMDRVSYLSSLAMDEDDP